MGLGSDLVGVAGAAVALAGVAIGAVLEPNWQASNAPIEASPVSSKAVRGVKFIKTPDVGMKPTFYTIKICRTSAPDLAGEVNGEGR